MAPASSRLLRRALALNCLFSLSCGLAGLLNGGAVAETLGALPAWLISAIGAGLILFAGGIAWTLRRLRIGWALLISGLDLMWVLGTLPLTLIPGLLTDQGAGVVALIALAVGTLGIAQLLGIRAMLKDGAPDGQYRHCIRVRSAAPPDRLWPIVRDLGNIAQYSASLKASRLEVASQAQPGAVRVCTNLRGQSWAEEVSDLDDESRLVRFRFQADAKDFPFPLAALTGGWQVSPDPIGGAFVDVWWTVTPKQRRFGWLVLALMTIPMDQDLPKMVGAMEAAAFGRPQPAKAAGLALGYC